MKNNSVTIKDNVIATTWRDGPYLLVVQVESSKEANWNLTGRMFRWVIQRSCRRFPV